MGGAKGQRGTRVMGSFVGQTFRSEDDQDVLGPSALADGVGLDSQRLRQRLREQRRWRWLAFEPAHG